MPLRSTSVPPTERTSVMMSATVWRKASRLPSAVAAPVPDEPSVLSMVAPASAWSTPRRYAGRVVVVVPVGAEVVMSQVPRAP